MAVADISAYNDALKEIWTQDRLENQYYTGDPLLELIEKTDRYRTGRIASTPLQLNRTGGYSAVPSTGSSSLNAADTAGIDKAEWNYTHHHMLVKIEGAAIDQTDGDELSVANTVENEISSALEEVRKQITRQFYSNGDALIAQCDTTSGSTTVELLATGLGYDAIVRRWLHKGLSVDIGTTADEDAVAADRKITAVNKSSTDPDIVIDGPAVTTDNTHYVSVANARAGTTSYESNGLGNIAGNATSTLGGITVASQPDWAPAAVDSTTTALTLAAMLQKSREIQQETGTPPDLVSSSFKQEEAFYKLLQAQVRFAGDNVSGGNRERAKYAGMTLFAQVDNPDRAMYFLTKKHLFIVTAGKPYWQNEITGGKPLEWLQGTTAFGGLLTYRIQLATNRRNAFAALTALTA